MCGFSGLLRTQNDSDRFILSSLLGEMAKSLTHRGPDDSGLWFDERDGIGFAHQRLSIVDISPAGHQPMESVSGRYVLVFNGEIYNHLSLKNELNNGLISREWRGHSDTEILLAGFEEFGVEETLKKSNGMFALALWDKKERLLTLARDRIGEKPLYYGWQGNANERVFLFGSELKALKTHPVFVSEIDRGALCLLLRHNYIPAPYSIYHGISKLEPGCFLTVSLRYQVPKIEKYWDISKVAVASVQNPFLGSPIDAVDKLETLTKDAINKQMLADVPFGAFLSGGIDSSTVVALMQEQTTQAVKTFAIGFSDQQYNEANYAKAVANHLGTDHTEIYVTADEAMEVIPLLPTIYCEPFADHSQIPNFLVSKFARQNVTISLTGDGGDELFCGYDRYHKTNELWMKLSAVPMPLRSIIANCINSISPSTWDRISPLIPRSDQYPSLGEKLYSSARTILCESLDELYERNISQLINPSDWVIGGYEPQTQVSGMLEKIDGQNPLQRLMTLDLVSYLPDDILAKVDRAAMAVSLECRIPLLDHRIIEFAMSLPIEYKIREGKAKWPLHKILNKYVPKEMVDRPKMGLGVPVSDWLRGPLRDWAESLLDETRIKNEGYFNVAPIRKKWAEHLTGLWNREPQLWPVLMFQSWLDNNK